MNKLRPKRFKNMAVDMTAMCDVTFLLLSFFVVTARFEQWEPMKISVPKSVNSRNADQDNLGIIFVADNKVMFEAIDENISKAALQEMSKLYHVDFTDDEEKNFVSAPIVGAPMSQLKCYDDQYMDWESKINRPGIPFSENDNQLFNWIREARRADVVLHRRALRIIIKADKNVKYATLKQVMNTLRSQKVNHVSLITESNDCRNFQ